MRVVLEGLTKQGIPGVSWEERNNPDLRIHPYGQVSRITADCFTELLLQRLDAFWFREHLCIFYIFVFKYTTIWYLFI